MTNTDYRLHINGSNGTLAVLFCKDEEHLQVSRSKVRDAILKDVQVLTIDSSWELTYPIDIDIKVSAICTLSTKITQS